MVPIQLQRTLTQLSPRFKPSAGTRLFVPGGILSQSLAQAARLRLTPDIRIVYGAAECSVVAMADAALLAEHPDAAGTIVPGATVEIVDPAGHPLPPGQPGEIRIQTDRLVAGYLDDDGTPGPSPIRGGWFYPGDLGRLTADGLLLLEGRVDDVMNLGGIKLKGSRLDQALAGCPGLVESFAFAAPDARGLAECCIALVTAAGFDQTAALARLQIGEASPPSVRLLFLDRLPRTPTGKVERATLVAMAAATR